MAESKSKKALKVTATLVVVEYEGGAVGHLSHGDVVPEGVSAKSLDHLKELGYVAEQD